MQITNALKKTDNFTVFFVQLGSVRAKAAFRTLVKLTPDNPAYFPYFPAFKLWMVLSWL